MFKIINDYKGIERLYSRSEFQSESQRNYEIMKNLKRQIHQAIRIIRITRIKKEQCNIKIYSIISSYNNHD